MTAMQNPQLEMAEYEKTGRWTRIFETEGLATMPIGEPDVINKIFVNRIS